jgi:hypothetical protein
MGESLGFNIPVRVRTRPAQRVPVLDDAEGDRGRTSLTRSNETDTSFGVNDPGLERKEEQAIFDFGFTPNSEIQRFYPARVCCEKLWPLEENCGTR